MRCYAESVHTDPAQEPCATAVDHADRTGPIREHETLDHTGLP